MDNRSRTFLRFLQQRAGSRVQDYRAWRTERSGRGPGKRRTALQASERGQEQAMKGNTEASSANPPAHLLHAAVGEALEQLTKSQLIHDEAVHSARKSLKKARAALRLLRDGMSEAAYHTENAKLRDVGHVL